MSNEFNFENEIQETNWAMLEPHEKRQAIYLISQDLDMVEVANVLARDDVKMAKIWLAEKKLRRPKPEEIETWEAEISLKIFRFIIVQPYVLVQLKESVNN